MLYQGKKKAKLNKARVFYSFFGSLTDVDLNRSVLTVGFMWDANRGLLDETPPYVDSLTHRY